MKRLRANIAVLVTDFSNSQQEMDIRKAATARVDVERCVDHPDKMGEYWCEDDCREVCKDCLMWEAQGA